MSPILRAEIKKSLLVGVAATVGVSIVCYFLWNPHIGQGSEIALIIGMFGVWPFLLGSSVLDGYVGLLIALALQYLWVSALVFLARVLINSFAKRVPHDL